MQPAADLGSSEPTVIVLNARSVLALEEVNFTVEQRDGRVYKPVKCVAMMRCEICNIVLIVAVRKLRTSPRSEKAQKRPLIYTKSADKEDT